MFVNFTNHSSNKWDKEQLNAVSMYGEILDIPFPDVDPEMMEEDIRKLSDEYVERILSEKPDCVLCQGEFCLSHSVINSLKAAGCKVVAACSKRVAVENVVDGKTVRVSQFKFVQFREYR